MPAVRFSLPVVVVTPPTGTIRVGLWADRGTVTFPGEFERVSVVLSCPARRLDVTLLEMRGGNPLSCGQAFVIANRGEVGGRLA